MIGLVDLNFQMAESTLPPPNLEIMKLAEYYKHEENIFCRIINLDEIELSGYEKIYIFSENDNCITVPEAFKKSSNIVYGGSAFTNKIYVPFENELIDYTIPRTNIYAQILKEKYAAGATENVIGHILDDTYYRRFAGKNELPLPPVQRRKRVYIYDRDFFQPGWDEIINDIAKHKPTSINFIHPAHFHRLTDFIRARENDIIAKGNDVFLDINIPLNDMQYMMKNYKTKLLSLILPSSAIYLSLGGSYNYSIEYYKNYIYKLNLLYEFWANGIPIRLKYENPTLGCYDPIRELSEFTTLWSRSHKRNINTIWEHLPRTTDQEHIKLAKEQLREFTSRFPRQEKLFKQNWDSLNKMGRWIK